MGMPVICIIQIEYNHDVNTFLIKCDGEFSIQLTCAYINHLTCAYSFRFNIAPKVDFLNPFSTNYPDH